MNRFSPSQPSHCAVWVLLTTSLSACTPAADPTAPAEGDDAGLPSPGPAEGTSRRDEPDDVEPDPTEPDAATDEPGGPGSGGAPSTPSEGNGGAREPDGASGTEEPGGAGEPNDPAPSSPSNDAGTPSPSTPSPSGSDDAGTSTPPPTENDGGSAAEGGVPMFVAIGKFGRITASCDDGRTWAYDRSDDDSGSCVGIDCDHHPGSATGLTYGAGYFFASFGWGEHPSRLLRSRNGVEWEVVHDDTGFSMSGLAVQGDRLILGESTPRYSPNLGVQLEAAPFPPYDLAEGEWPVIRQTGGAPYQTGRVAVVAASGDGSSYSDVVISRDGGLSYVHPTSFPDECIGHRPFLSYGGGVWLMGWNTTAAMCASADGGDTWVYTSLGETGDVSNAVWTGSEFVLFLGGRTGLRTENGIDFERFDPELPNGVNLTSIERDPATGTWVGIDNTWQRWYQNQNVLRSTDGVSWTLLGTEDYVHGHPLTHLVFARAEPSTLCPDSSSSDP